MGVIARHRSMEDWSISLGNTLLASIVCLLWYVFGLWEEADIKVSEEAAALTSAEKKVMSVDKEEKLNNGSDHLCTSRAEGEGHLYMLPEEGRQLLVEQSKQRQEEIQSAMQLKEEKAPIESKLKKTTTTSQDVRKQGSTMFQWPQNAAVLESAGPTGSTVLSSALEDKLKDLGIFRTGGAEESNSRVEGAARRCGLELTKKQVRVSFDTFMAKSRPGLESDEEAKESPKPKRKTNKKNTNVKEKKTVEPVRWHEKKERKEKNGTHIRTGGWSNPAWKMVQPQPSPALVRAF